MIGNLKRILSWLWLGRGHSGLVLDVGPGNSPHPRADVLCDRYLAGTGHRHGAPLLSDRALVCADICALPFGTRVFDFVFCRHVVEHLKPEEVPAAVGELMRVGKGGYMETPSPICELLMPDPYHRMFVELRAGVLVFTPKGASFPFPPVARVLLEWAKSNRSWRRFLRNQPSLWTTSLRWESQIRFRVEPPRTYPASCESSVAELWSVCERPNPDPFGSSCIRGWAKSLLHQLIAGRRYGGQ